MTEANRKKGSLQKRMALFFLFLLTGIVILSLLIVWRSSHNHLTEQLQSQFATAATVVEDRISSRARGLTADLEPVAKDFSFKRLISNAANDPSSLKVAMDNYQNNRWLTDIYWVMDSEFNVLVSSHETGDFLADTTSVLASVGVHWYLHDEQFYLMAAVPVHFVERSGNIDGWIVSGVKTEQLFDEKLTALTNMQVSITDPSSYTLIASTFPTVAVNDFNYEIGIHSMQVDEEVYLYVTSHFGDWMKTTTSLVLAKNQRSAYLSNEALLTELVMVLAIAALLAWIAAYFVSSSIAKPLSELIRIAQNISKGTYITTFPSANAREVETLSTAISDMQDGIKEREKAIHQLAFFDELTGLPNRLQFIQSINDHIAEKPASGLIVLTLDVDRFKEINDTVGHEIGDELLQLIAQRLQTYTDHLAFFARLSGDEFGLVVDSNDEAVAERLAQNVVGLFERPFSINDLVLDVDVSVGVAVFPKDAETQQGLIQCADIAMYSCKDQHYHYAVYQAELNQHSVMRLNLMSELKGALSEGQLQLYYQPKLSLSNQCIETVECLVRWIHPEHGFVPPDEFIPLAEQTGAIRALTNWALDSACKQLSDWQQSNLNLGAAVNISAMDLVDMSLPTYIAELLTKYQLSPGKLTLEVTESAVMTDPDSAYKALNILRTMGITLSIDDFGTGYSSMAMLKKMPVHELKIDKAFVLDLATNQEDQAMVKMLIMLARNLGLSTVAEGVEDAKTLALLSAYGCTKAQGFYLTKALPVDSFNQWYDSFSNEKLNA